MREHVTHLAWYVHYMSMTNGLPQASCPRGRYKSKSGGIFIIEYYQVDQRAGPKRNRQNFVTKLNHDPHLAKGLYYTSLSYGLQQAQPNQALKVKVWREVYY